MKDFRSQWEEWLKAEPAGMSTAFVIFIVIVALLVVAKWTIE